ncbi:SDR family NAD(P)-dependent oxidoreductase [Modestobacter roseus]|uniref:NAD(P)-dependent dehydrogenase (Short-subunit alcohol dehydrogenase family) n=1 Tax=Modestobacter roseus TaxID=1181884 RepID=A0A562IVW1_9ACTN|nr:SDR family NAD(P)-dependent oxidoreductase [Modestobacter roseus]TWH75087.1 NAD(P)-dependent dehydrogenase (short-subunit alcohol dehydrogenase family) [Modestobacter roseus]
MIDLGGKVALVTGAGSGIGRAIALGLSRQGAAVAVSDLVLDSAEATVGAIQAAGGTARAHAVDVADEDAVQRAVEGIVEAWGGLHVAVNNAGVPSSAQSLVEMSAQAWERVLRVDLTGTFFSMKHELPAIRDSGGGAVVNMASAAGLFAIPRSPAYVASKHGVIGLTKAAAVDHAADGIRVNALAPGMTRTATLEEVAAGTPMIAAHEALTPLRRLGTAEEIADAAIWLCSDEASYVTGTVLSVDGGRRA